MLKELPIACYGISMGGSIGLLAAAQLPRIKAVITDCAYADTPKAIARAIWMTYHIPRIPLGQIVIWAMEVRLRCRMRSLSPVRSVGKIAPRGLFIIHGMEDKSVPPDSGRALFGAAGDPKGLWLVPGAEHVACFYRDRREYLRRIFGFLDDVLF